MFLNESIERKNKINQSLKYYFENLEQSQHINLSFQEIIETHWSTFDANKNDQLELDECQKFVSHFIPELDDKKVVEETFYMIAED